MNHFVAGSGVLALAGLLVVLAGSGCGKATPPNQPSDADIATAERVYASEACGVCHGDRRDGSDLAPPLRGLVPWWTEDRLARYLQNPESFAFAEPEFLAERTQTDTEMPAFEHVPEADRRALARWLLAD